MKVLFEHGVDFVHRVPLLPTVKNCKKCTFYRVHAKGGCIRTDTRICQIGRDGYFVRNYTREVVDVTAYLEWKKEDEFLQHDKRGERGTRNP
jgi:hypothetical protein